MGSRRWIWWVASPRVLLKTALAGLEQEWMISQHNQQESEYAVFRDRSHRFIGKRLVKNPGAQGHRGVNSPLRKESADKVAETAQLLGRGARCSGVCSTSRARNWAWRPRTEKAQGPDRPLHHLAAVYDLSDADTGNQVAVNVKASRNTVEFAPRHRCRAFPMCRPSPQRVLYEGCIPRRHVR